MTDLEKFIDLYKGFGIELKVEDRLFHGQTVLNLPSIENRKIINGEISSVLFDKDGKFSTQIHYY